MRRLVTLSVLGTLSAFTAFGADAAAGKAVYDHSCRSCHGADGTPNATVAKALNTQIPDLKSSDVQSLSDADIAKIVTEGKGKMRPIRTVNAAQAEDVAAYIHSLKK